MPWAVTSETSFATLQKGTIAPVEMIARAV